MPRSSTVIRNAGIDGAGGADFPAYAKWKRLDEGDYLLVNHQESEPNYYIDKWLGRTYAAEFAAFFDALLEEDLFKVIVIAAKERDREQWMGALEAATSAAIRLPADLPLDLTRESGVVIVYTDDRYEYGMESVLLRLVADVVLRNDLPMDHGWIVQNTETLYNVYRVLSGGTPVTYKWVHIDGNIPRHRFLHAPVGTPTSVLLEAAGLSSSDLGDDQLLADGGPGWCFAVTESPEEVGLRKRTNCLLVLDRQVVERSRDQVVYRFFVDRRVPDTAIGILPDRTPAADRSGLSVPRAWVLLVEEAVPSGSRQCSPREIPWA